MDVILREWRSLAVLAALLLLWVWALADFRRQRTKR